jgi:hypothetical protein
MGDHDTGQRNTTTRRLTEQQLTAIDLFLAGRNVTEVAEAVGVHRATVSGWLNRHGAFASALQLRRAERAETTTAKLEALGGKAVEALAKLLDDASPRVRLMASKAVLGSLASQKDARGSADEMPPLGMYTGSGEWPAGLPEDASPEARENIRILIQMMFDYAEKFDAARAASGSSKPNALPPTPRVPPTLTGGASVGGLPPG